MFQTGNHTCKGPGVPKSLHIQGTENKQLMQLEHNKEWRQEKMETCGRHVTAKVGSGWVRMSLECQVRISDLT